MNELIGKRALVTGGSRGIGAAIVLETGGQGRRRGLQLPESGRWPVLRRNTSAGMASHNRPPSLAITR
jgi:hypothetical protein